jgi:hypothetical protein
MSNNIPPAIRITAIFVEPDYCEHNPSFAEIQILYTNQYLVDYAPKTGIACLLH